jgi:hypothetical protein
MTLAEPAPAPAPAPIRSTIPARLDRLRWSPFHTRIAGVRAEGQSPGTVTKPLTAASD